MNTFSRIEECLNDKGITAYRMCVDLSIPHTTYSGWKGGREPSAKRISAIAKYLGITSAYLLCETDDPTPPDTNEAQKENGPELNGAFFRLKQNLEPFGMTDDDVDFITAVYKAHKERNKPDR